MKRRVAIGAALVLALALAAVTFVVWPRGTSEVSPEEALDDFRSRSSQVPATSSPDSGSATIEPGVYTYAMVGSEDVKLGVLPTEHRPYPDTVTAVVVAGDPGCFTMTVNLLDQHTEDTVYCTADGSLRLAGHTKHQQVGTLSPVADMVCDPATLVHPTETSSDLLCTLTLDGGPAEITATLTGTAQAEPTTISIGDVEHDATRVSINYEISGGLSGSWNETLWLEPDTNLPLRIQRDLQIEGLATFTETSDLTLTDIRPVQ